MGRVKVYMGENLVLDVNIWFMVMCISFMGRFKFKDMPSRITIDDTEIPQPLEMDDGT